MRLTLVSTCESFAGAFGLTGADCCLGTGLAATGPGPVILDLTVSPFGPKLVLTLCVGFAAEPSVSPVLLLAVTLDAACLEAASAAFAALMAVSLAA